MGTGNAQIYKQTKFTTVMPDLYIAFLGKIPEKSHAIKLNKSRRFSFINCMYLIISEFFSSVYAFRLRDLHSMSRTELNLPCLNFVLVINKVVV